ncbi:hypothetical protein D3C81_2133310 [compost metagenome]
MLNLCDVAEELVMKRLFVSPKLDKNVAQKRAFDVLIFTAETPGVKSDALDGRPT